MRVRTAMLAGALAAGCAWGLTAYGPSTLAFAKEQAIGVAMQHQHVAPADQTALVAKLRTQYPELAAKTEAFFPLTAAKVEAVTKAYQGLPAKEREAIADDVNRWYHRLLTEHSGLRAALHKEGTQQEKAEWVLNLPAAERKGVSEDVLSLWQRLEAHHPAWLARLTTVLSR